MDTLHSDQVTEAVDSIRNRRMRGEYGEGNTYASELPPELRYNAVVVIESAYLFLVQGRFGHALETLDSYFLSSPTRQSENPGVVVGCLILMRGYAITQCRCKLLTAWGEAVNIRKTLLEPGLGIAIDPESAVLEVSENLDAMRIGNEEGKDGGSKFSRFEVGLLRVLNWSGVPSL